MATDLARASSAAPVSSSKRIRGVRPYVLGAAAIAILATACGGGSASPSGSGRTISVDMTEFTYAPLTIRVRSGETITLRLQNKGTVEHEFMAGRHAVIGAGYKEDWLALAKSADGDGHSHGMDGVGVRVQPKNTATYTMTVPAEKGEFEVGCFVPGHYESGMKGKLVVE